MKPVLCLLTSALCLASGGSGIRPRAAASDYPAHETTAGVTIAAQAIPPGQIRKLFGTDLNKGGYIVFEVAAYPENGQSIDIDPGDFVLRIGGDTSMIRAASPSAIASVLYQKNAPKPPRASDVAIYPTATIGYESGPSYDPNTGRSRGGGVYGGAGVGVATGGAAGPPGPPPMSGPDPVSMTRELEQKALPGGRITQPVAGYLYFPKPGGKARSALYELNWYGENAKLRVSVPPPSK